MTRKRFNDPIEALGADEEAFAPPRRKPKGRKSFDEPTARLTNAEVAEAIQSKNRAGRYIRKTFTFLPTQLAYIKQLAETEKMSMLSFMRWLVDQGLQSYEEGQRPEFKKKVVRGEPKLSHWTAQREE